MFTQIFDYLKDSKRILLNIDYVMAADESELSKSGNSTDKILDLLPILAANTNATNFNYLTGENLAFTSRIADCTSDIRYGLADLGDKFEEHLNDSGKFSGHNSIFLTLPGTCMEQRSHPVEQRVIFAMYRNHKLFKGRKGYRVYSSMPVCSEGTIYEHS
ncbi:hypothetical protein ANCCAN_04608 [Ancylostoma caninum]|uniref:Uncharacterized protein n=1 Tax=Ancylostoma caninum TaxID=29170 RepID=A0A368H290_ANCCA|nr:hypothetical protein ANCCAN_04608 [Ancylostoma caninum]